MRCLVGPEYSRDFGHNPLGSSNLFFRLTLSVMFIASTCPLACEYATDEKLFVMPYFSQKSVKRSLSNYVPFSDMIILGSPNRHIIFFTTKSKTLFEVMVARGLTSTHFMK